jgi:hypothetical protein
MSDYIPTFDLNVLATEDDVGFDLNVPVTQVDDDNDMIDVSELQDADDNDMFDVDEPQDDNDNDVDVDDEPQDHPGGNASLSACVCVFFFCSFLFSSHHTVYEPQYHCFCTTVDLNIPLDEFGAVDFSYVQNDAGKFFSDNVYL